jgi:hypothetical protein
MTLCYNDCLCTAGSSIGQGGEGKRGEGKRGEGKRGGGKKRMGEGEVVERKERRDIVPATVVVQYYINVAPGLSA